MTTRIVLVGSAGTILLAACLLPLLWPLIGLASAERGNPLALLADPALWSLLVRTLGVTAAVLGLALGIGLPMAVLVARTDVAGRGAARHARQPLCLIFGQRCFTIARDTTTINIS